MEDFVTFEIAKKLKEKQFNMFCESFYALEDFTEECVDSCGDYYEVDFEKGELYLKYPLHYNKHMKKILSSPTVSRVLKWLREEKKIHITVLVITDCSKDADNNICEEWSFWSFSIINLNNGSTVYDDFEKIDCIEYQSYEEATLAGIEYVLDNLI